MTREEAGLEGPHGARVAEAVEKQALIFKDSFPGMLGVRILEVARGRAVGELEVGTTVRHPGGYAHGGAIAGFGDTVAAWATFASLGEGEVFTTIEFKANFVSGVREGLLRADANVIHRGRRTIVVEVRITIEAPDPRVVALMIVTQAVIAARGSTPEEVPPDG